MTKDEYGVLHKDRGRLDEVSVRIQIEDTFGPRILLRLRAIKRGKVYEIIEQVERDNFKSVGEYAFEQAIRRFKYEMGWAS